MLEDVLVTHSSAFRTSLHNLSGNEAAVSYHGMAEDFRLVIGLIRELRSPFLRNRHREAVEDILGFSISAIPQRDGAGGDLAEAPPGLTKLDAARLSVTLGQLIERHAIKALPAIKAITTRATHEAILYQSLDEVRTTWAGAEFVVLNYNGRKDAPTLACIQVLVDDVQKDMAALVQLLESPHVSYIREELEGWHASLVKLAMQLDALTEIQSGLTRLTFQFRVPESSSVSRVTSFDLGSLIPVAERVLNDTEPWWRDLMTSISSEPSVLRAALLPAMKQQELEKHRSGLHLAMNEIRSHLQSRREAFPRLYLCADDALLPSIAQTSLGNAAALASPIIRSCFPAVSTFELGIGSKISKDILITSPDGGHISILFDFKMRCALEEWLHALNLAMHRAVAKGLKPCLRLALKLETMGSLPSTTNEVEEDADSKQVSLENSPLSQFWMDQPIQCIVIAAQVVWCRSTEFALRSNDHGALVDVTVKRESQCASIVTTLRGVSNRTAVMAISALLLAASNAAESARDLAKLKVCSSEDFHWSATLRFEPRYSPARIAQPTEASYSSGPSAPSEEHAPRAHGRSVEPTEDILDPLEDCEQIMICLGGVHPIQYGLEYVGAAHARLLVTQASERCWLSLLTLVNSGFGVRLTGSGVSTNRQLASTAASFAAIIGEPFFSVDCTTAGMAMNSETSDVLPWACSQLLRCVAHTHTHWGCFCGLDTLGCDALVIFEAAITEVINKSRLTETSCGHHTHRFPRIVVTTLCSEQITHNYCSQDLHGSAFRSLAAATPDIARTVILHLNVHGIERAEPLGRRIASFWTCLPGLVVSSTQSCTGLGSVHGLAQILNCLSKWSGDNESLHLVDLSRVSRDHPHAIVIAKLRAQILRMFSRVLDTSALDALLHDIFSEAYNVPTFCPQQQVQESPFEDDTKTVWSALAALAPLRWKFAPSGDFVFQARRLHDALLNRQDNSSKTAGMVGLIGDPGSGKTTLSFAAAALATASHGVEEGPKGIARPLLSIVATNALPVEHLWGSFSPDGTWRDGAASAMMRAASMVSGPQIDLPVSDAAKCGFAAGARWVLFDIDGANLFPHSCVTDDVGTDTGSASQLEVICAPLIFGDLWTRTAGECSIVNRCNTVQLAPGEHILCGPQMRLLVECGTHTGLAPSTLVLFNLFHVDETVISWYELGCAWATNACAGFFEIKSKGSDSDAGGGQGVTLPSRESIAEEQKLLSSFRSRLLDLLQCVFRPMLNELNEMMSLGMHISPPPPKTAVRSLANHFDTILLDINPKALRPLLLAASSALEKGPRSHESTVACLIDPLFVFATAWALGSCVVDNIPLRTRLEAALQACIIAEDLTQSAKLPAEGKNLASIFDFWPAIVLIEQTKKIFPGNDAERLVSKSFSADQIGGISPSDFSMLFAEEASSLQVQGPSLTRGHLPPGFDLAFAGSMTHGTEDEVVPIAPITDVKEVDPPRGTPTIDENYFKQSIVKVRWTHWPSTLSTQSSIGLVDPSHILVGSSAQFRASKLLNSASCGSQRIGALLLGPHGSGKTTIAKFALLGNPKPGIDASSMPVSESKLTVSICAAVTATQLHAQLASFGLKGRSCALSIFIDDISVPRFGQGTPRGCGDCPRELIRGLMSHCGAACAPSIAFCSATLDPELCMRCAISSWKPLRQPLRLLATAPVAGPLLSERFKRHFWIYELGSLDESSLRAILAPYTQAAMQSTENHTAGLLVTETLSDIILSTAKVLPPVPSRPYGALRGLHDVVRIIGGIAAGARLNHDILRKSASLNPTSLASLCLHECRRVLGDPLGSQREQIILEERLASITAYHFNVGGSAWDCKALFRDPERPLVFVDLPQSHQQQGEVMKTGFDDPIDVKNRREICRSATQLRNILDFHASSHSTSTQGIQHSEVAEDSIGRVPPVNKNTLIAGDGALRVAGVLHALHRQRHMFLIGKPGDQRPAIISLASHIAGLGLVVARGASDEEEFGKHILVALRHAVLTAAKAAAQDPNGPRRKTKRAGLFQSPSWKEVNLASLTGQKPRPCEYFAPKRQILFRLLLRLACLPHEARGTARGIVRDAYDKLTASSHVIQESKERANLDDLTTHKLNRALSVISGPLSAKKVAGASLLNLLLIGDGFTQDDSIHEDSIFSFVRGLAGKFGVPCVRIVEHGSRGKLTMSALEIRATNSKPKVVGRFLSQEEICRFVNDARSTGEWVLLHQLENFQEASISWISQLCTDSPAESNAGFRLLFSTNMAHVAIRRLQASVQCCARVFRCWNSRWIAAASESSQSREISCQNVDGTSAPQPGHTVGSPISSNLPDPFDSLASNYRIRVELQFKFNASSGIYGNAEARVLYRALMMRLPQRLELDVIGQSRSWRTLSLKVEADRHNALIDLCHNTLSKLVGGANTFPEHGDIIAKISAGLTPARWVEATQHFSLVFAGRCIANPRLDAWLRSLQERVEYLRKWISDRGPLRLWLGVLFSPQSYLQGALLDVTRDRSSRFESMSFVAAPFLATDDVAISPGSILAEGFLLFHVSRRLASEVLVTNKNASFFHNSGVAPLLLLSPGPRRSSNLSLKEQPDKAVECPVYSYRQSVFIRLLTAHLPAALGPELCSERTAYLLC